MNSNTKHGYPVAGAAHEMHADHREHSGHNQHAGHSVAMFRDKFWLSLAIQPSLERQAGHNQQCNRLRQVSQPLP